jgi:hypothetical protein
MMAAPVALVSAFILSNLHHAAAQSPDYRTQAPEYRLDSADEAADRAAAKAAQDRRALARSLVGPRSIYACNVSGDPAQARKGYTGDPVTLEPVRYREKELCVAVPVSVTITKWACEFAKDRQAQLCVGFGNGACDVIGWVWPTSSRVYSSGHFNYYCVTGHQDSDREWRYFNIHLYNDSF